MKNFKTYDLSTVRGAARILFDIFWPIAAVTWGWASGDDLKSQLAFTAAFVYLLVFVAPGVINWYAGMVGERMGEIKSAGAISEESQRIEAEIRLEKERQTSLHRITYLNTQQLGIIEDWRKTPAVEIDGARFVWRIGGGKLPAWFAPIWLEKWEARGRGDLLPGQADYSKEPRRDLLRSYNNVVTGELIQAGAVSQSTSHYPPRWLVPQENREEVLIATGVYNAALAYEISSGLYRQEGDPESNGSQE